MDTSSTFAAFASPKECKTDNDDWSDKVQCTNTTKENNTWNGDFDNLNSNIWNADFDDFEENRIIINNQHTDPCFGDFNQTKNDEFTENNFQNFEECNFQTFEQNSESSKIVNSQSPEIDKIDFQSFGESKFQLFEQNLESSKIVNSQNNKIEFAEEDFQSFGESNFQTFDINSQQWNFGTDNSRTLVEKQIDISISHEKFKDNLKNSFNVEECDCATLLDLEQSCKESSLLQAIQGEILDPIKTKKTLTYQLKLKQIDSLLDTTKTKEEWLIKVQESEIGTFRSMFDFHDSTTMKNGGSKSHNSKTPVKMAAVKGTVNKVEEVRRFSNDRDMNCKDVLEYNGTSQKLLEIEAEMKKAFIDLSSKSVEDLRTIVEELEIEAKIYSEILLSELDLRDDLVRQQEVKNNFISKQLAVERKISELKKKKTRSYGFFKLPEENKTKILEWSIPYISQENGPTTTDISLLTELLSSIEKDDPETPRLISEYVFKLGNSYDLDTVIRVRTQDGVKTINTTGESTR